METSSSSALHDGSVEKDASSGKTDPAAHPAELQHESLPAAKVDASRVDDFPDGGLRGWCLCRTYGWTALNTFSTKAWSVVFGSWLASACTFGYISAFGAYSAYYETHQLANESSSNIAWIGSIQLFGIFAFGLPAGYLFDAGHFRPIFLCGTILIVVGVFATAECEKLWHFMLAQALVPSVGYGLLFVPSAAVLGHWFKKRRALAFGVIATGSSIGSTIFPIMLNRLFNQVGFRWAVRICGFVILASLAAANVLIRPRLPPRARGNLVEFHHLKDPAYTLLVIAAFFIILGLYFPIFTIVTYAESKGVNSNLAFYILSINNACSTFGRLIPNLFADKIGPQNILYPASALAGILCFIWLATNDAGGIIAFAVVYGPASGAYVSTIPACIANLTKNMNEIGARTSLAFAIVAFASLAGTPITGALLNRTGSYTAPACFAGVSVLLGVGIGLVGRQLVVRRTGTWRV